MALFSRDTEDEHYTEYAPLEEFAPTYSKQEVMAHIKIASVIAPIRDIPLALRGRRDQIEEDLTSFSETESEEFEKADESLSAIQKAAQGHIQDTATLAKTMERVNDAIDSLSVATKKLPEFPDSSSFKTDSEIPQINLPKLSEEYMPDNELVEQIRSYSSFSDILKKSTDYTISSLDQYHEQVKNLSMRRVMLENLAAEADLLALHATIDATHMNEESKAFSTKVAGEIGDLSRKIHEVSAALDAELDTLENGFKTVRSSINTIESAHRDVSHYADTYSSSCNEYFRQSTNYTNILIQSLSSLNREFRDLLSQRDTSEEAFEHAVMTLQTELKKYAEDIIRKGDRIASVLNGCIRGASSLGDEMAQTLYQIKQLKGTIKQLQQSNLSRKDKYTEALLKAFDHDLIWLQDKIESVFDSAKD